MNVSGSNTMQAVNIWALQTSLAMGAQQAMASVATQITNNLASLDPNLGRSLDVRG